MPSTTLAPLPILSPQDHDHFIEHGYVIIKHAVSPDVIAEAVAALETGQIQGTAGAADYKPVRAQALHACASERFAQAVGELFGEPYPMGPGNAGSDMPRPYQPTGNWNPAAGVHVDDDYPTLLPNGWAVGSFLFLTPVQSRGGAFVFCPGSPRLLLAAGSRSPGSLKQLCEGPAVAGVWREHLAEPGDLLLFHHLMAHSGSTNVGDPRTRHALLSRHHPTYRVAPGNKPFEAMTTIEKANSARYLRERFGDRAAKPALADDGWLTQALAEGVLPLGLEPVCQAAAYFDGCPHLFVVGKEAPSRIRHARSRNWADWEELAPVELPAAAEKISSLHFQRQLHDTLLLAGCRDGGQHAVHLLESKDGLAWSALATLPGVAHGAGHRTSDYGNKSRIHGNVVLEARPEHGHEVHRRLGKDWRDAAQWTSQELAAALPEGQTIAGLEVQPTFGEGEFALVVDASTGGPGSPTRMLITTSNDCLQYGGEFQELPGESGVAAAHGLRVLVRGRRYWLASYLRQAGGQTRLFWGVVDFEQKPVRLRELRGADDLRAALAMVGLV